VTGISPRRSSALRHRDGAPEPYLISIFEITIGYHRYFTHRAFTCGKPLRIALAIVGGIALEGPDALVARRADRPVFFERLGWVRDVRWPDRRRIAACHAESPHKAE
jgi:hypothetical protein